MKSATILYASFIIGVVGIMVGALLKLMHWANSEPWLITGVLTWAVFIITAIYEVSSSKSINRSERMMWIVGFVLMGGLTALVYMIMGRKRVVRNIVA